MKNWILLFGLTISTSLVSQSLYFPPLTGNTWQTMSPDELNWCPDSLTSLINYVGSNNSKAFLILKDGKMVSENYYGTFTADSIWYWASAGKTITSFLIGQAQQEGLIDIQQPSSLYQGNGWTSCTPEQEQAITVWHQLTMTTGLDFNTGNLDCTEPQCLTYLNEPGTEWFYHNAPYTRLDAVIEGASGLTFNQFYNTRLRNRIGMNGLFLNFESNNVNFSNARSMARFGILMLNRGIWNTDTLMSDQAYFDQMVNTSQNINEAYGYLWWLNGKDSFRYPGFTTTFNGFIMPDAPVDLIAALGKNGQFLMIVPSQNLIVIRLGDPADGIEGLVPTAFANQIMRRVGTLECEPTGNESLHGNIQNTGYFYDSNAKAIRAKGSTGLNTTLFDINGRAVLRFSDNYLDVSSLSKGLYLLQNQNGTQKILLH